MKQHNCYLAKCSIEKAEEALKAGYDNIEINLNVAQNRAYYAVFYSVMALGYLDEFITSKHHELMGWFNKKYVYELKIFSGEIGKTYNKLIRNRETFDYNVTKKPIKDDVLKDLSAAKTFVKTVNPYILKKIAEFDN